MFVPCMDESHQYAVVVSAIPGRIFPLRSYPTLDSLAEGYKAYSSFARNNNLSNPIAIEFMQRTDKGYNQKGTITILTKLAEKVGVK